MKGIDFPEAFKGWVNGYQFAQATTKADEILQGKNYYLAIHSQFTQALSLGAMVAEVGLSFASRKIRWSMIGAGNAAPLILLPVQVFFAVVRHGHYESFANGSNLVLDKIREQYPKFRWIPNLPPQLSTRTCRLLNSATKAAPTLYKVAMITGTIALSSFGKRHYIAGIAIAVSYQLIDSKGYVPKRISLFMETYLPTVAIIGNLLYGTLPQRVLAAVKLPFAVMPSGNLHFQHALDSLLRKTVVWVAPKIGKKWDLEIAVAMGLRKYFSITPRISAIDGSCRERKNLTYNEMIAILDANPDDYVINASYSTKPIVPFDNLPASSDFKEFLTLFDRVDWKAKGTILKRKLLDDDIFIDWLKSQFDEVDPKKVADNRVDYLERIAANQGTEVDALTADWTRRQMEIFVQVLEGERRVKGLQQDLYDATEIYKRVLPYLKSLEVNSPEFEDMLMKIAIEGGDYCARGLKGTALDLLPGILPVKIESPAHTLELKLREALFAVRSRLVENFYQTIIGKAPEEMRPFSHDKHAFDSYRTTLSFGFLPLSPYERRNMDSGTLLGWLYPPLAIAFREPLLRQYRNELEPTLRRAIGERDFSNYMRQLINENESLSGPDKEALIEMLTDTDNSEETMRKFHQLMFVMLGVLIEQENYL